MDSRLVVDIGCVVAGFAAVAYAFMYARRSKRAEVCVPPQPPAEVSAADAYVVAGVPIASAVLSSVPLGNAGGDLVDVFELDSRFTLLLVADVSGKGVEASAHTAFIRYTLRTLAMECDGDPAVILAKFNAMYPRTIKDREAFVDLIVGIIDAQTGIVRYASAGHEPAYLRRSDGTVTLLAPTGPIVGAAPFSAYGCDTVRLAPGDVLVWTTDGLTESRDAQRRLLGADALGTWIAQAPTEVSAIPAALVNSLRHRSGVVMHDDVAVLAIGYNPVVPVARQTVPCYRYDSSAAVRNRRSD